VIDAPFIKEVVKNNGNAVRENLQKHLNTGINYSDKEMVDQIAALAQSNPLLAHSILNVPWIVGTNSGPNSAFYDSQVQQKNTEGISILAALNKQAAIPDEKGNTVWWIVGCAVVIVAAILYLALRKK
jgi:hypothetical protein